MANQILTMVDITKESLRMFHNDIVFTKGIDRSYQKEFAQTGAKRGTTINIRKPNKYYVRTGPILDVQDVKEEYTSLTLDKQYGVDLNFSSVELKLSIDEFSDRYIVPAMAKLASKIDLDGLSLAKKVPNYVGTPGYTPGSNQGTGLATVNAPAIFLNAGRVLDDNCAPRDGRRSMVLNSAAHAGSANGMSGMFNAQNVISEQYRSGLLAKDTSGFDFVLDQNINTITMGSRAATALISGANQTGTSLTVSGLGANATVAAGEKFTIGSVYGINLENQQTLDTLRQFAVTTAATANSGGVATLTIYPDITLVGATVGNGTVNILPVNGATLTWQGTASTTYTMNLAYHKEFATFATADLDLPNGTDTAARQIYDGISMRLIKDYNITNDTWPCRIDILSGWAVTIPEYGCVVFG